MKLIVSVMPRSLEEVQALDATRYLDTDIIEWRADHLTKEAILQVAPAIFEKFAGRELVFTLRTRSEGEKSTFLQKNISISSRKWRNSISQIILILSTIVTRMF